MQVSCRSIPNDAPPVGRDRRLLAEVKGLDTIERHPGTSVLFPAAADEQR